MQALQEKIGYSFKNTRLLEQALTHSSSASTSYERLEFLGDRILGLSIAKLLYDSFPNEQEGSLAKRLNALVKQDTLRKIADKIQLDSYILVQGAKSKTITPSVLSDVIEALLAAIYLDGGFEPASQFVRNFWADEVTQNSLPPEDDKSKLQEWVQAKGLALPIYKQIERTGPDHSPSFVVEVTVQGYSPVTGSGTTKQAAEKAAAKELYQKVAHDA